MISGVPALNRVGRAPARGNVVIAGARALPALCPLLIGVGGGDITSWNLEDATTCSLMSVAGHSQLAREPGLARALFEMPATEHGTYRDRYDDMLLACVFALVMATPPQRPRQPRPDRELTARIADAATHALRGLDTTPRGASTT